MGFALVAKTEVYIVKKDGKEKRRSPISKNEHYRRLLQAFVIQEPGPLVVNNSWGLFDRSQDAPIGSPENYSANPDHPFNQIVGTLVAAGADVFFAAGNCGSPCPDGRCGNGDFDFGYGVINARSVLQALGTF